MQVRLAFAVAAHLEPEILVVDEVLAVGDAQFQRKCLGKMHRVAGEGRTVLFVSHNIGAVQQLCGRGLLLNSGLLENDGSIDATIKCYMRIMDSNERTGLAERVDRAGKGLSRISHLAIRDESGALSLMSGSAAFFEFEVTRWLPRLDLRFTIYDGRGTPVFSTSSPENGSEDTANGNRRFTCEMRNLLLRPGSYRVNCALHSSGELQDHVEAAAFFEVESGLIDGQPATNGAGFGSVLLPHRWTLSRMQVQLP
jgi:lipopolysaccharide transport system ATP-binding protein